MTSFLPDTTHITPAAFGFGGLVTHGWGRGAADAACCVLRAREPDTLNLTLESLN